MVNWMAEHGLVESPQRAARATAAKQIRVNRKAANQAKRGVPTRRPPKTPPAKPTKVRRTPFTIENSCTMLYTQWWFKGYDKYKSKTDLCRWGGAYKKGNVPVAPLRKVKHPVKLPVPPFPQQHPAERTRQPPLHN